MDLIEAGQVRLGGCHIASLHGDRLFQRPCGSPQRTIFRLVPVVFLTGNHPFALQGSPPLRRHAGQFLIRPAPLVIRLRLVHRRPCLLQVGLRLPDLLIHLGSFNFGERLPGADAIADIHHPALDVSVGPSQDGRLGDGLDIAGEFQFAFVRRASHFDHVDPWQRPLLLARLAGDEVLPLAERNVPREEGHQNQHDHRQKNRPNRNGGRMPQLR